MAVAKTISGSVVPATRRARRTGSESLRTRVPASMDLAQVVPNPHEHRRSAQNSPRISGRKPVPADGCNGAATPARSLKIAVGDGSVNHVAQLAPHRIGARRYHLGHEDHDQFFRGIDKERGGRSPTPVEFTGAAGDQGLRRVHGDGEAEAEPDAV